MPESDSFPSIPTKILLPIDFSPSSQAALEMAPNLALHFHAELSLVNAIAMFSTTTFPDLIPETEFIQVARTYAEHHLVMCHKVLAEKGIKSSPSVELGNDVAGDTLELANRKHIDMIVISTHEIWGWHRLVFGAIAEKVVKLAQCPLLFLHSVKPERRLITASDRSMEWW